MSSARSKSVVRRRRSACHSPRSELRRSGITAPRSARVIASVFIVLALSTAAIGSGAEPGRWAVLVGVNDYAEVAKLEYCVQDMQALRDQLVASGFAKDHVFLLSDKAEENKYRPLKPNIERQLDLVLNLVEPDDLVVIGFSGHGVYLDGKSYLCPSEARLDDAAETMLSLEAVYDKLAQCPASLKLFLVDACRNDPRPGGQKTFKATAGTKQFAAALERPPRGILLLTSCNPGQISMEEQKFGHGVFMHYVLEGLRGQADDDKSGSVSLLELYRYANRETKTYVARRFNDLQVPALKGDLSDDFDISRVEAPKTITNSIGMKLTLIPAGEFLMGSPETEEGRSEDELQHRVRITRPFYLGTYEVTKEQFRRFVEAEDYRTDAEKDGKGSWGWSQKDKKFYQKAEYNWRSWGVNQGDTSPVVQVSWNDAAAFCQWLSRNEGKAYRLPTEAEWEYACRGGTTTRFYNGDDPESLVRVGNVADQDCKVATAHVGAPPGRYVSGRDGYGFTAPVGKFRPNAFGLYDMHGNVWEWCSDWYDEGYYARSPTTDPKGPSAGSSRVARGGGWFSTPVDDRCAYRDAGEPGDRLYVNGFRVVCELE